MYYEWLIFKEISFDNISALLNVESSILFISHILFLSFFKFRKPKPLIKSQVLANKKYSFKIHFSHLFHCYLQGTCELLWKDLSINLPTPTTVPHCNCRIYRVICLPLVTKGEDTNKRTGKMYRCRRFLLPVSPTINHLRIPLLYFNDDDSHLLSLPAKRPFWFD